MPKLLLPDVTLNYESAGSGVAQIVLVHSWGTSLRVWDEVADDLRADHSVVAYDLRGCGRSDPSETGNTIAGNTADLIEVIRRLELSRPIVVGSSIGAVFGQEAARRAPSLIAGIGLVDGPGYWPKECAPRLLAHVAALATDRTGTLTESVTNIYSKPMGGSKLVDTLTQLLVSSPHIDNLFVEQTTYDPRSWLRDLTVPACYIHGKLDQAIPISVAYELALLHRPPADVIEIADAGHMSHQEQPTAVAAAVRAFARQLNA